MFVIKMIMFFSWFVVAAIYLVWAIITLFTLIKNFFKKDKPDGTEITRAVRKIWEWEDD